MLGGFLYGITEKDARTQPVLQRVVQLAGSVPTLATTVDIVLPVVPQDRVFHVTNIAGAGIAGAAQTVTRLEWNIIADGVNSIASVATWVPDVALLVWGDDAQKDIYLMPGEALRMRGIFSGAANANVVSAGAIGVFLPKGNLQLR